jgi:hypothetical protein
MVKITIIQGLPFISVEINANKQSLVLERVLLDSGASDSVFKTDDLEKIGVFQEPNDLVQKMTGIGGDEYVIEKTISSLGIGELRASPFTIQLGAMDYGMKIDGIIGMDFLLKTGAKIDFGSMEISA